MYSCQYDNEGPPSKGVILKNDLLLVFQKRRFLFGYHKQVVNMTMLVRRQNKQAITMTTLVASLHSSRKSQRLQFGACVLQDVKIKKASYWEKKMTCF